MDLSVFLVAKDDKQPFFTCDKVKEIHQWNSPARYLPSVLFIKFSNHSLIIHSTNLHSALVNGGQERWRERDFTHEGLQKQLLMRINVCTKSMQMQQ